MNEDLRLMFDRALGDGSQQFGSFILSRLLGFKISYEPDTCIVSFDALPPLYNPQGTLHGGVIATALDISMGHLLHHHHGPGSTLEMKVQYLLPIRSGNVHCRAQFLNKGRKIFFLHSKAISDTGEISAYATSTWKLL